MMTLHLDLDLLQSLKPKMSWIFNIMEEHGLFESFRTEVGVFNTCGLLLQWSLSGELACFIAFVLYAVFVVSITVLDFLALMYTACVLLFPLTEGNKVQLRRVLYGVRVLGKLAMLDVSIVGVYVVSAMLSDMHRKGVIITPTSGLMFLLVAEACHYALYYIVTHSAEVALTSLGHVDDQLQHAFSLEQGVDRS